ncbi:MAG: putative manganese-dependent inorganic diphosphatase [Tissierellales bacterium]|jgi:manganese-dependent inorganic pyrophosphatase|nr:putative manganese-dependent inorganic diphosphatase [Tissierellales bacterium]
MQTLIFGHKNPDTDTIASTLALSYLKNQLGYNTKACALGEPNKESKFILDFFDLNKPEQIDNVKIQVSDLDYDKPPKIRPKTSIRTAFQLMEQHNLKALPIIGEDEELAGVVTMKDIAMSLVRGDIYTLETSLENIINDLDGTLLKGSEKEEISGKISVIAFHSGTIKGSDIINENSIIIVGNRYGIIEHAISKRVKLIIITGEDQIPERYFEEAKDKGVNVIATPKDTYTTSKLIHQANYISSIMTVDLIKFYQNEYLEDVVEEMRMRVHSNYPIVDMRNNFKGFISRKHVLNPGRKNVIIVDHNEYSQSAEGLKEANILEIVDHHKIGDMSTSKPINFRNMAVGSTCTIVYQMYRENMVEIPYEIAGILLSGIISDTLLLKSPTTTELDSIAVSELNVQLGLDLKKYAMKMFRTGTSLEGQSIDEIFYKDFKEFVLEDKKVGISQIFTLDIEDINNRREEFLKNIELVFKNKEHDLTLMLVTDIMQNGSYMFYRSDTPHLIANAFEISGVQGCFANKVVSRKKQVIPALMQAIRAMK